MYWREVTHQTEDILKTTADQQIQFISEYAEQMTEGLQEAWKLAKEKIQQAKFKQKTNEKAKNLPYLMKDLFV